MSRQKGTPNKRTVELVTEYGNIGVVGCKEEIVFANTDSKVIDAILENKYLICIHNDISVFSGIVNINIHKGYKPAGGIAIHDIRNPLTNEYEPHFYQAMEKLDN